MVFCGVSRLVVLSRGLVWAFLSGSRCFAVFFCAVLCWCADVLLCGVLSCCVVCSVAGRLRLALAAPFLLVLCGALLCRAVLCGVSSCVVPSRVVVCCAVFLGALWCRGVRCGVIVWSAASCCVVSVVSGCPALPPPLLLPLLQGLLLLPGPLSWPVDVLCPGVRFCVVLLCRLSCVVLLSASFLAGRAALPRSRWLVRFVVACCFWVFIAGSGCPLLFSGGVLCRWCSCLTAWLAALVCAVVFRGAPLRCAVSCGAVLPCGAVLCGPDVCFAFLVVLGVFP